MKNPGFYLPDTGHLQTYRMHLRPTDVGAHDDEIPSVSICIMELVDENSFSIVLEDDSYAGRAWGYFTP